MIVNGWRWFSDGYVRFSFRRPALLLLIFAIVSVCCAWTASVLLRVETDLAALLPAGTPSVLALNESKKRIGSTDFFTIALESKSGDAAAVAALQDQLAARIEDEWPDANWVQVKRDTRFFRDHALYYLPIAKLEELLSILKQEMIRLGEQIYGSVVAEDTQAKGETQTSALETWYDPALPKQLGLPPQVVDEFNSFFQNQTAPTVQDAKEHNLPAHLSNRLIGPLGEVGVVLVQLDKPSTNLEYARFALNRGEKLIAETASLKNNSDMRAQVVGAYRSFKEVDSLSSDGLVATLISVVSILILMMLFFRSFRTLVVVFLPLMVAGCITMGITAVTFGRLTALTVFILAMLVGMGIDYGIHLFGRIRSELGRGLFALDATMLASRETGIALLVAAATTIASLLTLLLGHFDGFKEFGIIAAYGLSVCVLIYLLMVPPVLAIFERLSPMKAKDAFTKASAKRRLDPMESKRGTFRLVTTMFVIGLLITAGLAAFVPGVGFEHDFRKLRRPRVSGGIGYGRAVGKGSGTAPAVILGQTPKQMSEVHEFLIETIQRDPRVRSFITLETFVPSREVQLKRRAVIEEIGKIANKRILQRLTGEKKRMVDALRLMTATEPFGTGDIPRWASMIITEKDGTVGLIGHMYTMIEDWNAEVVEAFQDDFGALSFDGKLLPIASSGFILSDVVKMVKQDGERLVVYVAIALLVILALFTRKVMATVVLFLVVVLSGLWTAGAMSILGLKLGLYNILVIPVALGVGVDGAIHLYHRHMELGRSGLFTNLKTTGLAISASSITTIAGFSGLLFIGHNGLRTIGELATISVGLCFVSVLLLLPFLLFVFIDAGPSADGEARGSGVRTPQGQR